MSFVEFTTDLPDEPQQQLDNGVLDEITVNRDPTTNNGEVRYQIRRAGENEWNADADGFDEVSEPYDADVTFTGLLDGEEYAVRGRTETEHKTGEWNDPKGIVTRFPGSDNLVATVVDQTTVDLSWVENADNEDGQLVVRERRVDGEWWPERIIEDVGANVESYTDETVQPDTEYRYRMRSYTEYAEADSNTDTATTDDAGFARVRVPVSGPYVQVETPDREAPITPTITDIDWSPDVNQRPEIEVTVPQSDRWDELIGEHMWVWLDGTQLPIDTLEGARTIEGDGGSQTVLEASGAEQLDEYTDDIQFDEKANHLAAEDLIDQYTEYDRSVDNPATDTRSDVLMLSESGASLDDDLLSPVKPTDPIRVDQLNGISRLQTGWFTEAEDADVSGGLTRFADQEGNPGAWSGGQAIELSSPGDSIEFTADVDHIVPQGELILQLLRAVVGGDSPGFDVTVDGERIDTVAAGALQEASGQFDLSWGVPFGLNADGDIAPSTVDVEVEVTESASGSLLVDAAHIRDDRDAFTFDETPVNGVIDGPGRYPGTVDIVFDDITSVEQVIAGNLSVEMSNTEGTQAVAISNDEGATWIEAGNAESVAGDFASATQQIRARVTLSGYSQDPSTSPAQNDAGQSVDEIELRADLEDTPVLLDKQYRDRLANVLASIADDGRMVWEARRDPDADPYDPTGVIVEWTQIGQRTRESAAPATSLEKRTTIEDAYERVVVFGRSKSVEGATFSQSASASLTSLGDPWIVPDSERIYDPGAPEDPYERGEDYRMEWDVGGIEILDGGDMETGTTYAADYDYRYRGEATTPTVDSSTARTVERQIPGATSDRECNQLALSILKDVQEAQVEAELTLVEPAPDVPLVEAISHPRLPEGAQEIRGVERSATNKRTYRLANRRTAGEIFDDIREDYESLADVV